MMAEDGAVMVMLYTQTLVPKIGNDALQREAFALQLEWLRLRRHSLEIERMFQILGNHLSMLVALIWRGAPLTPSLSPVRVDEHSLESLELTLKMLSDPTRDFQIWNHRAGGLQAPKVAAIVMTMVGSKSQVKATPDQASRMYIERAIAIAEKYPNVFGHDDPSDAFVLTDDFHSAGRISGAKRIPISELKVGSFHRVENRRLQVNDSTIRYQKQLGYLARMT